MSKTPLYKMLQDVPSSGGWTLATLLDGSVSGSQLLLQAVGVYGRVRQRHKRGVHQGRAAISDCGRHSTSLWHQRHLPLLCSILPYYITKIPQVKQSPRPSCMQALLRV